MVDTMMHTMGSSMCLLSSYMKAKFWNSTGALPVGVKFLQNGGWFV